MTPNNVEKRENRGGLQSHMFDRERMILMTRKEQDEMWEKKLKAIKAAGFGCPIGWIRAQFGVGIVMGEDDEGKS